MPINPLKEFFKRKKAEVKFARAGPGQKLSSDTSGPSSSSTSDQSARQAAAEAAMKRFNKDNNSKPAQRPRIAQTRETVSPKEATEKDQPEPKERVVQKELEVVDGEPQRNILIYSTEELAQRIKQPEIDDNFFRLTIEDAKLFQQRYDEEKARNEILKTSEMRRREVEAKKPSTNIARLRFKLPNDLVLEASFSGHEYLDFIRNWLVAICLEKASLELHNFDILFGLRPLRDDEFRKSVRDLGMIPATTLTIVQK